MKEAKNITIYEIAKQAGVHPMTVSRALRKNTVVSKKTRQKIQELAKELNYRPNPSGAALRIGRTLEVGITYEALTRVNFGAVLTTLNQRLSQQGYYIRMMEPCPLPLTTSKIKYLDSMRLQGLILANAASPKVVNMLNQFEIPCVWLIEHPNKNAPPVHFFGSDDMHAARELLEHLYGLGHRQIAHLYGSPETFGSKQRKTAYLEFMAKHRLEPILEPTGYASKCAELSIKNLLQKHPGVTALACSNDNTAIGAMYYLQCSGFQIPRDYSITGFGCVSSINYKYFYPRLTTAKHPYYELDMLAIDRIVSLMDGKIIEPGNVLLPAETVLRGSTGPVPTRRRQRIKYP
jgi:LacI family transcriptional regulator